MAGLVADGRWVGIDLGGDRSTTVLQSGEREHCTNPVMSCQKIPFPLCTAAVVRGSVRDAAPFHTHRGTASDSENIIDIVSLLASHLVFMTQTTFLTQIPLCTNRAVGVKRAVLTDSPPRLTCRPSLLFTGEIIRSELGGHDTPSLVAFKARDRSIGEAAVSLVTSAPKNTIGAVRTLAGTLYRYL